MHVPRLAISMGDPGGIGPETLLKALADDALRTRARWVILGVDGPLRAAARKAGITPFWRRINWYDALPDAAVVLRDALDEGDLRQFPAHPAAGSGTLSFRFVTEAIRLARLSPDEANAVDGIVTGPISKEAWSLAGQGRYPGHTELLAESFGVNDAAMFFHAPPAIGLDGPQAGLNVILVTVHQPLRTVAESLTPERVRRTIRRGEQAMRLLLGGRAPRIAVCGLNPHAGEHGLLGHEDDAIIRPAVDSARAEGVDVVGPLPADTLFSKALSWLDEQGRPSPGRYDLIVAMYHDQGLAPLKLLAWDRAVNVTVGLPTVRTSPDHGTAFDIAGQGVANPGSMAAAMKLAITLASAGRRPTEAP